MIARSDALQFLRGLLMGCADIVPGVSGGTVALILGIYERLVGAISRFDVQALRLVARGEFRRAAVHVDLRFLVFLLAGIATALLALGSTMHFLLEHHRERTLSSFFGMILASTWLVTAQIGKWSPKLVVMLLAGGVFAYWLVGLPVFENPPRGMPWLFFCGAIAICAMILPGISGAFILLILGEYYEVTGVLKKFAHLEFAAHDIGIVVAFVAGALVGILSFSRVLKWLLRDHHAPTMAVLAGFMLGSLRKIWPFQVDATPQIENFEHKSFDNLWPDLGSSGTWITVLCAVVAGFAVLALEKWAARHAHH